MVSNEGHGSGFHDEAAINKLNSLEEQQSRIQLLFTLIEAFKAEKQFDNIQG